MRTSVISGGAAETGAMLGGLPFQHRLTSPVDADNEAEDRLTAADLATAAACLFDTQPYLRQLYPMRAERERVAAALAQLDLPPPMAAKLTAARNERPRLFEHLLVVTLICHFLSRHADLAEPAVTDLLLAALLHDLGELHIDPALLTPGRRVAGDEMRYIYAHPLTGYVIAQTVVAGRPDVATAVLQHQERLDGSGYPFGLRAADTGRLARIIAVADVSASILSRFGNVQRLSALMRLNHAKYDAALIAPLQQALCRGEDDAAEAEAAVLPQLKAVAQLLRRWDDFRASLSLVRDGEPPALAFLFERMRNLNVVLRQFGFDPDRPQGLRTLIAEDRHIAGELAAALNEVCWQFADLEREILRHKDAALMALPADKRMFLEDWLADLRRFAATAG